MARRIRRGALAHVDRLIGVGPELQLRRQAHRIGGPAEPEGHEAGRRQRGTERLIRWVIKVVNVLSYTRIVGLRFSRAVEFGTTRYTKCSGEAKTSPPEVLRRHFQRPVERD